jgi:hypothetical protein
MGGAIRLLLRFHFRWFLCVVVVLFVGWLDFLERKYINIIYSRSNKVNGHLVLVLPGLRGVCCGWILKDGCNRFRE